MLTINAGIIVLNRLKSNHVSFVLRKLPIVLLRNMKQVVLKTPKTLNTVYTVIQLLRLAEKNTVIVVALLHIIISTVKTLIEAILLKSGGIK